MSTDDPHNHPCRTCKAKPGQPCHTPAKHIVPDSHPSRRHDAEDAWLWAAGYEPIHGGKK